MEAENDQGWCLPEAQMTTAGMLTMRSMFDPLTVPNDKGEYVPFLAKAVTPNKDFTEWTITLREGVKFHDGSPLNAVVVKNNLDAFRGQYPARQPLLFLFTFMDVADVSVKDEFNVVVTTKVPWRAFPAFLNLSNRFGIMAQSQLDDPKTCDTKPVGTGPFMIEDWKPGNRLLLKKNPNYWIKGYPLLDELEFRPMPDPNARRNALLGGEIDAMHTSDDLAVDGGHLVQLGGAGHVAAVRGHEGAGESRHEGRVGEAHRDNGGHEAFPEQCHGHDRDEHLLY